MLSSQRLVSLPLALAASLTAPSFSQVEDLGVLEPLQFWVCGNGEAGIGTRRVALWTNQAYR